MLAFLINMVELSSKTCHSAFYSSIDGHAMLYRSEIDNYGAEISPLCHFSAGGRPYRRSAHTHDFWQKWCRSARSLPIRVI